MEILLTKSGKKGHVFSCKRKDGTVTWKQVSHFFILHDLCHYAVETGLILKKAFFGMLASGTDISEFDLPKEQRNMVLEPEALFAEQLVNLLTIDYIQGRMENLAEVFATIHEKEGGGIPGRQLTGEKLDEIRKAYSCLILQWEALPEKETMKLLFEE